ncbi:eukaryotic translation initiation factor 2 subunit alpha homolog isoform X2 [Tasmannia lanceolata]|uniref:eukaryotic translation initiation factor 2 subunit alpha homolog isoform X2 n=1 Tax=Tasmannia lanceolata TaxID=3420 RepID=UPI0040642804
MVRKQCAQHESILEATHQMVRISASWDLSRKATHTRYPQENTLVMIQVNEIADMGGAHVSLLEYNNIEGMILFSELSHRRTRTVNSLIKIGRQEPVMVLKVEKTKGYIDLGKRGISEEDRHACIDRFNKSKLVHSIMGYVSETMQLDFEDLNIHVGWPLYRKYGHAFEAFKLVFKDPDSVLNPLTREVKEVGPDGKQVTKVVPAMSEDVKYALIKNIRRRMPPQPQKIRAYIKMKGFQFDGVLHIKEAMRRAEASGNNDYPVKIKLVTPPLYALTTQAIRKGILVLNNAIKACTEYIDQHKGVLVVKEAPRAVSLWAQVSEHDDKLLPDHMEKLWTANEEVSGNEGFKEEEETKMGEIDLDNSPISRVKIQKVN